MSAIDSSAALAALTTGPLGADGAERLRGRDPAEAAKEFEVLLLTQVISAMRKTVGSSGLLSASPERRILDGAFDEQIARSVVDGADLGLARQIAPHLEPAGGARAEHAAGASESAGAASESSGVAPAAALGAQVYRRSAESILNARYARPTGPASPGRTKP